ncbi:uroporphyrinogen decarboxylase [Candidatus Nitronereus thalassa]|uniref:Uroporphyrinogen decarboxylase n=1 Tax=Candidatus Nitronereus thalassa TaxID=3020898 RepID=A0ABU3K533_9BACT|nr:uroporphyrinogen decarboxylase [Candidatus Nitronereus thalassa]MDT7041481.1 uroporphyrinogen decarboxylase [Candidatus Nitronereus thalassa]
MTPPLTNDRFLRACRRQPVDRTPVWFMRQAGRYMAEYQAIRKKHSILDVCKTPELAAEVTLQPIERFPLDAAIIFADILLPLEPMGLQLSFVEDKGPVIANPVRSVEDVERLRVVDGQAFTFSHDAMSLTIQRLAGRVPLIGFAGGPFTLASYAIEGGSSRSYITTKRLMFSQPKLWHALLEKFSDVVTNYLLVQIDAGAQAIQLFDSWVGCLSPGDYEEYALPHVTRIIDRLRSAGVPLIYFGTGTSTLLPLMKKAGSDVVGLDWHVQLDEAWARLGYDVAVQGNLDPVVLYAPVEEIDRRVKDILTRANQRPGHIFNLGHGILPQTPVAHVDAAIASVHKYGRHS